MKAPIMILTSLLTLSGCKLETEHTIKVDGEVSVDDDSADADISVDYGDDYGPINTLAKIEPAIEADAAFFSNQERYHNWLWNDSPNQLPCDSTTLGNMPFSQPHWYFSLGCQFTSFSCGEVGWYEQVHNDFFLIEITHVAEHVDPKNCLGKGTYLCEFARDKHPEKFDYNCEPTDEELEL